MAAYKMLVEDSYGVKFFKELINRLKQENVIPKSVYIDVDRCPADCNKKLDRILKAVLIFSNKKFKRAILIFDGDGNPKK